MNNLPKDDKLINHVRNVKLLQAIHEGKKFYVVADDKNDEYSCGFKEIELPNFELYEEKLGYKWVNYN